MRDRFKVTDKKALMCRFHVQTAGSTLTAQQPNNNIVRTSIQALAAVIGGAQSIHTNSKDEALSLPTKESTETALRTQQIIAYESGVPDVVDPISGSYFVESLTQKIEEEASKLIKKIDQMGGSVEAIKNKFQENEISNTAYKFQKSLESLDKIIVGINKFQNKEENIETKFKPDQNAITKQLERLEKFKSNRDINKLKASLNDLKETAKLNNENLMPYIIRAIKNNATLGEISNILKDIYGEHS